MTPGSLLYVIYIKNNEKLLNRLFIISSIVLNFEILTPHFAKYNYNI